MLGAVTGVVGTVAGGAPSSRLIGPAKAGTSGFSFVQISGGHIGLAEPANSDARLTLNAAIDKIVAIKDKAASPPDCDYSDALKSANIAWNEETLDTWLTDAPAVAPGARCFSAWRTLRGPGGRDRLPQGARKIGRAPAGRAA